ncbi:MAG: chitobiase/beta-hexosaminidase C-terminal domain-containing protein [Lachnospiraceae bacterium]|nr:chitobiase/beta-hexosaminidase C-terminal domain-containing protein [Lachnospiraceae bacterium]
MQCPKCDSEIPEGKLYCPNCGYAVQIVPDYDADLEENLNSVGSDIAGNVNRIDVADNNKTEYDADSTTKEIPMVKKEDAGEIARQNAADNTRRERMMTVAVAGIFAVVLIVVVALVSKSLGNGSFIPQTAVDEAVSSASVNSVSDPMSAAVEVAMDDEFVNATLSEDSVSSDSVSENETVMGELIVTPEGGRYGEPENISARISYDNVSTANDEDGDDFEGIIYYTTDGSEPDEESKVFKGELPMPVGKSKYAFRFLDSSGNLSDTIYLEYDLEYEGITSPVDAANIIIATLINDGALLDIYGHVAGSLGAYTYICDSMVKSGSRTYFMIPESYEEPGEQKARTGTVYAVDAETLETFKVSGSSDGKYSFEVFY